MFRTLVLWIQVAVVALTGLQGQGAIAQEYRTSVRDLDRRFKELVRLNQQLTVELERREQAIQATVKSLGARIESLERARQRSEMPRSVALRSSDAGLIEQTRESLKSLNSAVDDLRSEIERVKSRLKQLESQRNMEPQAENDATDRSEGESESAKVAGFSYDDDDHRFHFHLRVYDNYEAFKKSPDFERYQEENRRAGERFSVYVENGELRQQAALNVLGHRRQIMVDRIASGKYP
jgi:chromosome segregation ATPase